MVRVSNRGFTIIELLVTIVVFGLVVPGLVGLITSIDRLNDRARDLSVINSLVENKTESLRSISYTGINNGAFDFTSELPNTIGGPRTASYTISSINSALKQVDLVVTYNDHGTSRTLSYRTYIGELGVGQY